MPWIDNNATTWILNMKNLSAILSFLTTASLYATPCCPPCLPCSFLPPSQNCVSNPCLLDQSDVYLQFSFLYWIAQERGLDYALKNKQSQFDAQMKVYQPSFNWQPAFRILLGTRLPYDHWSLDLAYSFYLQHIDSAAKHHFTDQFGEGLLAVWTAPGAFISSNIYARWQLAQTKWKIHANFFDFMLHNDLYFGNALCLEPSFGLKMATLQQRFSVVYTGGNSVEEDFISSKINLTNRSFNLGFCATMTSRWHVDKHWNLFGAISGALLASQFDLGRNEFDVSSNPTVQVGSYRFNRDLWTWRPQSSLSFGVKWSDCMCQKTSVVHYGLKASYEMQYWWKENMMLRHIDAPATQSQNVVSSQQDLVFQGLTVDLFFDF